MSRRFTLSTLLLSCAACGDNLPGAILPDAAISPDAPAPQPDAPSDLFVPPTPFSIDLSAGGPDQLMSAAAGPGGTFYAAGYAAATPDAAKLVTVVRLTASGALDPTFATGGVFTSAVEFAGGSDEIDLVVQSTGSVVVAATIASETSAADRDVGLIRISPAGALDAGFGASGLARLDLNTGYDNGTTVLATDAVRGLAVGADDALFVHAVSRADGTASVGGPRLDSDFTVARLSADGALDTSWGGGDGKFLLDFSGTSAEANATPRAIHAFADGSVLAGGYANTPAFNSAQAVLYRLGPAGALDPSFASGGVFFDAVLAAQTEIYGLAVADDKVTTGGYGRAVTSATNDWVSLRFDAYTGARDTLFGAAVKGAVTIDPSGAALADNCRNAIGLPDGSVALLGSVGASGSRDAAFAILTSGGLADTRYGDGTHVVSLGGPEDQFWGGAVSGGALLLVGWRGQAAQAAMTNDDARGALITLR